MSWTIDSAHTEIAFSVRHMMITNVRGRFDRFSGTVEADEQNPANSKVEVQIEAASISTRDAQRDGHLRSPDFLAAEQFPVITFKSTRMQQVGESRAKLYGDLTIRDITRPVVLDVEYLGQSRMWGKTSAGFKAHTAIDRKEWGLTWNMAVETGGILVGDEIKVDIELELVKQPEAVAEAAV